MNRIYLCVSWWRRRNVCPYCWKICNKIKQQPWIVAVYWSLERQIYFDYWKHIQCEGPAVRCKFWSLRCNLYAKYVKIQQREVMAVYDAINRIAAVKSSINCIYLCVGWSQRYNVCSYCWKISDKWLLKTYTMWGSSGTV